MVQTETDLFPVISAGFTSIKVVFPNVSYDPVADVPYLELTVVVADGEQPCIKTTSKRAERDYGDVIGSLFMPSNKTEYSGKRGSEWAEDFKNLLSQRTIGQTILFTGKIVDAGLSDDKSRYRYNIIIPYQTNTENT